MCTPRAPKIARAAGHDLLAVLAQGKEIARAGLRTAWLGQFLGRDVLTACAVLGREIAGLDLAAVVPTYPRHPLALAGQALSTQAVTGNRLTLCVGASHRFVIEDIYGYSFERPARHMREYLTALIPLLRGETIAYQGETLRVSGSVTVPAARPPALLLAALGPAMLRLAGELTEGTVTTFTGPRTIAGYVVPTITAAAGAGRPAPRVVHQAFVCVTEDPSRARERFVAQYPGVGQAPSYRAMYEREGVDGPAELVIAGDERTVTAELGRFADAG